MRLRPCSGSRETSPGFLHDRALPSHRTTLDDIDLVFANNGAEAISLFQENTPDLIFMDISMPIVDGKEATAAIRQLETDRRTPIIALTAHAMAGDEDEILKAGLDGYLTKPLRKPSLLEQIETVHTPDMAPLYALQEAG